MVFSSLFIIMYACHLRGVSNWHWCVSFFLFKCKSNEKNHHPFDSDLGGAHKNAHIQAKIDPKVSSICQMILHKLF